MAPGPPPDRIQAAEGGKKASEVGKKLAGKKAPKEPKPPKPIDARTAALQDADDADKGWSPGRRRAVVAGIFIVAVAAMVRPTPSKLSHQVLGNLGDPAFLIWSLRWGGHAVVQSSALSHPGSIFNANIYWPYQHTLAYSDNLLSVAPLYNAFYFLTHNWALSLNLLWLCDLFLNMGATYSLTRWLTRRTEAGVFAGLASGFSAFVLSQVSHPQLQLVGLVPLGLLLLFKLLERPRVPLAVGLGVANVVIVLSAQYFAALYLLAVVVVLAGWFIAKRGRPALRLVGALAVAGAITLLAAPSVIPYTQVQSVIGTRQLAPVWNLHPADVVRPAAGSYLYRSLSADNVQGSGERHLFPGFLTMALAALGALALLVSYRRPASPLVRPAAGPAGPATASPLGPAAASPLGPAGSNQFDPVRPDRRLFLVLLASFGLVAAILAIGAPHNLWTPWKVLYRFVPGASGIRVTARLAVGSILAGAVLAGYGLDALLRHLPRSWLRLAVSAVACAVVLLELAAPLPWVTIPTDSNLLAAYKALSHKPGGAVVELPMTDPMMDTRRWSFTEPIRQLWATLDWHPRLNGYSGFAPMTYNSDADVLSTLPSPAGFALLQQRHIRYLILHIGTQAGYPMFSQDQADAIVAGLPPSAVVTRYGSDELVDLLFKDTSRATPSPTIGQ